MIELDGSFGEGGGQILRTSLTLSLITKKAFRLRKIRAGRPKPGLQPQHLMSVRASATIGQARVRGDALGSRELVFEPDEIIPGVYRFDIGTAGATSLVLHTLYLPLAWQSAIATTLTLRGGTHVLASPCYEFLEHTWRPYLELLGLRVSLNLQHIGFYPRGGGIIEAEVTPCSHLPGWQIAETPLTRKVIIRSAVAGLPDHIAERQAKQAAAGLEALGFAVEIQLERWNGSCGSVVEANLETAPVRTVFFELGRQGKRAERVADDLVKQVTRYVAGGVRGVDPHSADQLVLPLALAEGPSSFPVTEISSHLLTNIAVIRQFLDRSISCSGSEGEPGIVSIL
jgi:RNA 3'-phosphate cyclase